MPPTKNLNTEVASWPLTGISTESPSRVHVPVKTVVSSSVAVTFACSEVFGSLTEIVIDCSMSLPLLTVITTFEPDGIFEPVKVLEIT